MNCKDFEKMIPDFIEEKLEYRHLESFVSHAEECPECMEELNIQFLVAEGMVRLEMGGAFDLKKELDFRMENALRKLKRRNAVMQFRVSFEMLGLLALMLIIYILFF